jgi:hypothetical protein
MALSGDAPRTGAAADLVNQQLKEQTNGSSNAGCGATESRHLAGINQSTFTSKLTEDGDPG